MIRVETENYPSEALRHRCLRFQLGTPPALPSPAEPDADKRAGVYTHWLLQRETEMSRNHWAALGPEASELGFESGSITKLTWDPPPFLPSSPDISLHFFPTPQEDPLWRLGRVSPWALTPGQRGWHLARAVGVLGPAISGNWHTQAWPQQQGDTSWWVPPICHHHRPVCPYWRRRRSLLWSKYTRDFVIPFSQCGQVSEHTEVTNHCL